MGEQEDLQRQAQAAALQHLALQTSAAQAAQHDPNSQFSRQLAFEQQQFQAGAGLREAQRQELMGRAMQYATQPEISRGYLNAYQQMVAHQASAPTPAEERKLQYESGYLQRLAERGGIRSFEHAQQLAPDVDPTSQRIAAETSLAVQPELAAAYESSHRSAALLTSYQALVDRIKKLPAKFQSTPQAQVTSGTIGALGQGRIWDRPLTPEEQSAHDLYLQKELLDEKGVGRMFQHALEPDKQNNIQFNFDEDSRAFSSNHPRPVFLPEPSASKASRNAPSPGRTLNYGPDATATGPAPAGPGPAPMTSTSTSPMVRILGPGNSVHEVPQDRLAEALARPGFSPMNAPAPAGTYPDPTQGAGLPPRYIPLPTGY